MKKIYFLLSFISIGLLIVFGFVQNSFADSDQSEASRTLLVKYKDDQKPAILNTSNPKKEDIKQLDVIELEYKNKKDAQHALAKIAKDPQVEYVEQESTVKILLSANDTLYSEQWYIDKINANDVWDSTTGVLSVKVAIIDTGVDGTHEDLSNRIGAGYDFVSGQAINANADSDDNGHGTNMAGVIAAYGNNSTGIAGINWGSTIMPVKVIRSSGVGLVSEVAQGIIWAADQGAKVINMSFGGFGDSSTLKDAIDYAAGKGAILIGASGNDGVESVVYPAAYENVFAVGATDSNDNRASYSSYGDPLDLVAPGSSIATTNSSGGYSSVSGTSISAAVASGAASLLRSQHPNANRSEVTDMLKHADKVSAMSGNGWTREYGNGRLNILSAVESYGNYSSAYVSQSGWVSGAPGDSFNMSATFKNTGSSTWSRSGSNPVVLAVHYRKDMEAFNKKFNNSWVSADRIAWLPNNVAPGETVTIPFSITIPSDIKAGEYQFYVQLVAENFTWLPENGGGAWWTIKTNDFKSSYVSQSSWVQGTRGESFDMNVTFTNSGSAIWNKSGSHPVILAVHYRKDMEAFNKRFNNSWVSADRIAWLPNSVAPGETVTIPFSITIPGDLANGDYQFYVQLVAENHTWLPEHGGGAWWTVQVR